MCPQLSVHATYVCVVCVCVCVCVCMYCTLYCAGVRVTFAFVGICECVWVIPWLFNLQLDAMLQILLQLLIYMCPDMKVPLAQKNC